MSAAKRWGGNRQVVERFYGDLWNNWRLDVADEILTPDIRFRGSFGQTLIGCREFKRYVEMVRSAFPDWHSEVEELIECGDSVVARLKWTGTHRGKLGAVEATGARVSYVGAAIFHFADRKIHDAWVVGDTQELWRALGLLRA
jgi:predicted ester cyclase